MEASFVVALLVSILLRAVLDLTTLKRHSHLVYVAYVALFTTMGIIMLYKDHADIFGYASLIVAVIWAAYGGFKSRKHGTTS